MLRTYACISAAQVSMTDLPCLKTRFPVPTLSKEEAVRGAREGETKHVRRKRESEILWETRQPSSPHILLRRTKKSKAERQTERERER